MKDRILTEEIINEFHIWLVREEKSEVTVEKYLRDVRAFLGFAENRPLTKELVRAWKNHLLAEHYAAVSINSMLASLNSLLCF